MRVFSFAVIDGYFTDEFGKRGTEFLRDMPTYSIPFSILDAPSETKCFAFILEDNDAPGGCFVHWLGANMKRWSLDEDESKDVKFPQGANDWYGKGGLNKSEASRYGGMAPPDKEHLYEFTVYALDTLLEIDNGFTKQELLDKMQGHILATAKLQAKYKN